MTWEMMVFAVAGAFVWHNPIFIEVNADAAETWEVGYGRYMTWEMMAFAFAGAFVCHNRCFIEVHADAAGTWKLIMVGT